MRSDLCTDLLTALFGAYIHDNTPTHTPTHTGGMMTLAGTIIHKFDREQVTDTFAKQAIVIKTDGQYPQEVKVDVTGKALDHIPDVGTVVTAHIDLKGRGYERKDGTGKDWWTSVNCWRIETGVTTAQEATPQDAPF